MDEFQYQQPQRFRTTNRQRDEEKKRKSGSSGGIPDRWLDYLGVNSWIENTRFIAFKCPLKPDMQKHLANERRFTLGRIVEKLDDKGKELGLIIDLTNTDRYYKATDIADAQIQYHKMMTPGHNQIPSEKCYQQFEEVVHTFLEQNKNNDKLIGVHCTHGLNRTGYLIVRYMIERMGFEPSEALEAFNRARGHSMEKYTEDLLRREPFSSSRRPSDSTASRPILNDETTGNSADQVQWPAFFSTVGAMSLDEERKEKRQPVEPQTLSHNRGGSAYENCSMSTQDFARRPSDSNNENQGSSRQAPITPRLVNSTKNGDEHSTASASTYFGSGSSVGRGRPLTGDR